MLSYDHPQLHLHSVEAVSINLHATGCRHIAGLHKPTAIPTGLLQGPTSTPIRRRPRAQARQRASSGDMPLAVAKRANGANAVSATCRLAAPLAVSILGASIAVAETTTVGAVDKVQASVEARQAGRTGRWLVGLWIARSQVVLLSSIAASTVTIDSASFID